MTHKPNNFKEPMFVVVTVDGPAGAGKTTIARKLAKQLGFCMLDSGALYRTVALALLRAGIIPNDEIIPDDLLKSINIDIEPAVGSMQISLDGEDVSSEIRSEYVGVAASIFSAKAEVRRKLLGIQRSVALQCDLVAEGRDMGEVVFPFAQMKFFLTASAEERAKRRYEELLQKGAQPSYSEVFLEMRARDHRDETRALAPMVPAKDATIVDTTNLTPDQILGTMLKLTKSRLDLLKQETAAKKLDRPAKFFL